MTTAPYPAAKLVQCRKAEAVSSKHNHGACLRNINADLDNRRSNQEVECAASKLCHRACAHGGGLRTMHNSYTEAWQPKANSICLLFDPFRCCCIELW